MFTGLIEAIGRVEWIQARQAGRLLSIVAPFSAELAVGDSVAVNGVCLTVIGPGRESFTVEVVAATLQATTFGGVKAGREVNLERALASGDRLGGHFVQGHVDEVGRARRVERRSGYWTVAIEVGRVNSGLLVPKGSVCVDGVSLTVAEAHAGEFAVNVIPHTWEHTTLGHMRPAQMTNIEYDLLVKAVRNQSAAGR